MIYRLIALLFVLSFGCTAFAQTDKEEAYRGLVATENFSVGGVGIVGTISTREKMLYLFISPPDYPHLLALTREKSQVAQLYGLLGLRYSNYPEYKTVAKKLMLSKDKVSTVSGCIMRVQKVSEVATSISQGSYNTVLQGDMERVDKPVEK